MKKNNCEDEDEIIEGLADDEEVIISDEEEVPEIDEDERKASAQGIVGKQRRGFVMSVPIARKSDIVKKMSKMTSYKVAVCSETFEALVAAVRELILEENHVLIRGLGTFVLRKTRRRKILLYGRVIEVRPIKKIDFDISQGLIKLIATERIDESGEDMCMDY